MIVRCDACMGKKKVMGLGMLMKDCAECDGMGYYDNAPDVDKPKRGRPFNKAVDENKLPV